MQAPVSRTTDGAPQAPPPELIRAAFRELHGARLHGFALLLTLGDRSTAARLASDALSEGSIRAAELSHPERAAAWLRARVVRRYRPRRSRSVATPSAQLPPLEELGVTPEALAGLAALDRLERAALVAATIERLDRRDVAVIVGRDGRRLGTLLQRSMRRYLAAFAASRRTYGSALDGGPISERVRATAARAMA